ncbi:MAG: hypothetical protein WB562_10830 [Candidatus Sulfotelmatobacter sp.]
MKTKTESVNRTPNICANFSASQNDTVQWQGAASGCQISQDGTKPWPFNLSSPITLPTNSIIKVVVGSGTYYFNVSCCTQEQAVHTVTVS